MAHTPDGHADVAPVTIPRPIPGLFSKRVLVMDFIEGTPLSRLKEKMAERGIEEGSPESIIFGRRLLTALTEAYARMIFGPGFIHGDSHPGIQCGRKHAWRESSLPALHTFEHR